MPDLRTELQNKVVPALDTLKFDDEDDTPPTIIETTKGRPSDDVPPTNNVTRATFEFVRANPRRYTRAEASKLLVKQGYKLSSVTALITQMLRAGIMVKDDARRLIANVQEYTPIKRIAKKRRGRPPKATVTAKPPPPLPQPAKAVSRRINVDDLKLSEARALYDELKKIFG